ncbi:hypothetical protein ANCDUO_15243, partial [Ancylostoma duodenale]
MDENFNSLAEEQKEPTDAVFVDVDKEAKDDVANLEKIGEQRVIAGFGEDGSTANKPDQSLEKLAVPWDITETALIDAFSPYGNCRVEWPCKEVRSPRSNMKTRGKVTGYVYMVFETERSVRSLLQDCSQEFGSAGEWYFKLKARRNQTSEIRQVQVIPWVVSDSSYNDDPSCHLDPKKT